MNQPFLILARRENGDWLITTSPQHRRDFDDGELHEDIVAAWNLHNLTADEDIDLKGAMFLKAIFDIACQEGIEREDEERAVRALRSLFRDQRLRKENGDEYMSSLEVGLMRLLQTMFEVGQTFGDHVDPEEKRDADLLLPRLEF